MTVDLDIIYKDLKHNTDLLYGSLKAINDPLYKKMDDDLENISFLQIVDFAITSNGLSFIKNFNYNTAISISCAIHMRNIIEYNALREMYVKGLINENSEKLIKYEGFINDYYMYTNYLDYVKDNTIINKTKLQFDFDKSANEYNKLGFSNKINKNKKLRFLLNEDYTYSKIIEKFTNEYFDIYNALSIIVHPHYINCDLEEDIIYKATSKILNLLFTLYFDENVNYNKTFTIENKVIYSNEVNYPTNYALHLRNYCLLQQKYLLEIVDASNKVNGENYFINDVLKELGKAIVDVNTDFIHGFNEMCKMKYKILAEYMGYFIYILQSSHFNELIKLSELQTAVKWKEFNGENYDVDEAYNLFLKIYPDKEVKIDDFKNNFQYRLYFLKDKDGEDISYSKLVKNMSDYIYTDKELVKPLVKIKDMMIIDYIESIKIGHGNGYLYLANDGALSDDRNIVYFTEFTMIKFLELLLEKERANNKNKTYINALRNKSKVIKEIAYKKFNLYLIKKVAKNI